jgi:hypothetical protein
MTAPGSIEMPVRRSLRCEVNDRILETYALVGIDGYEECELFCECARPCNARILVPAALVVRGRRPGRFLVSPGHVGADERIAGESRDYWVVERA